MTRDRIALAGVIFIAMTALIGGIILTAMGIQTPGWLTSILTLVGAGFALFVTPPKGGQS